MSSSIGDLYSRLDCVLTELGDVHRPGLAHSQGSVGQAFGHVEQAMLELEAALDCLEAQIKLNLALDKQERKDKENERE